MKTDNNVLKQNFIGLFKRAERFYRDKGNVLNATYCAEIRRAIRAVKIPKDLPRKEVEDVKK